MSYKCLYVLLLISDRLGIGMLTFALLMSARMGIFQETLYKRYGKHSKEALFYNVSVSPESDFFRVASRALFEPFKLHRYWSFSCFCVALPASAGLPAPLHGHLQPLRLLQSEQWVPLIYSGEPTLCLLTSRCKYISLSLSPSLPVSLSLSAPTVVPVVGLTVPLMWLYLLINVITQYPVIFAVIIFITLVPKLHDMIK